jgi:small-conductance mechanosensitive channel
LPHHTLRRSLLALLVILSVGPAYAQGPAAGALIEQLTQVEAELQTVDRALDRRVNTDEQNALRGRALAAQQAATALAGQLEQQLALIDARLAGIGTVPEGTTEAPDISAERASLGQQREGIDAAIKRGRLAGVEAQQLVDEIDRSRVEQFSERISARVASPLTPRFWGNVVEAFPRDARRITSFLTQGTEQVRSRWKGVLPWQAMLGAIAALVILFPLRRFLKHVGQRFLIEGAPGRRVRRSANALWRIVVGTLTPLLAAAIFMQGLRWAGLMPERWSSVADAFVAASGFSGFVVALGSALLMRDQPSWRVAPLRDETAARLTPLSWLLAGISMFNVLVSAFNTAVGASQPAVIASQTLEALLQLLLIITSLFVLGRLRSARSEDQTASGVTATAGQSVLSLFVWVLAVVSTLALLLGFISFSLFIGQLIAWTAVLGATLYLLMAVVDDVATSVFTRASPLGIAMSRGLGLRGSMIDQFGLLLSGGLRLLLVVIAFALLMTPFGGGGGFDTLFAQVAAFARGVQIGGIAISPGAILRGAVVLAIGLTLVRLFMSWLENRYLPATDLDGSGRNSVSLVARYVGIALAVIWALASLNIGVERIALLLSALSVGIGFGLQAITQNFVSGLILLAERPIKIGDLIRVGTDEGDVKRISVRSTEIVLADHSTLIVPNSELITKTVLNKTLAGPLGRIQIQFSVPIGTDPKAVSTIVMDAFKAEPAVLEEPAPSVFVDAITDSRILFNCFAHVASPRVAYGPRSNVLMTLLSRFGETGIDIGTVPQRLEMIPAERDLLNARKDPDGE